MKVLMLSTKKVAECNDSYGTRLIEQGKAVIHVEAKKAAEAAPCAAVEEAPAEETKRGKKR